MTSLPDSPLIPRPAFMLFILAAMTFTHIIDFMIIMPLGAQLMKAFEITPRQFSWLVSVYAFSAFVSGLLSASFMDRLDRRKALLGLYGGFIIGTFACGLATNFSSLLVFRALTGVFGGVMGATVLAIIGDVWPVSRRGQAIGTVMTAFSVASVVGVPLGLAIASTWGWSAPFLFIGGLSLPFFAMATYFLPPVRFHLKEGAAKPALLSTFISIGQDKNQLKALLFTMALMLGHFSIIPFIAPYMQKNIGFSNSQVTYIYLIGGSLTAVLLPLFGKLSDRYGQMRVFGIATIGALFSIAMITNLPIVPIGLALLVTSTFFVVASGRNVPALSLVTSVVPSERRGGFMNVRASAQEASLALGSFISGLLVTENSDGQLIGYHWVGWFAIIMSIVAYGIAKQLKKIG